MTTTSPEPTTQTASPEDDELPSDLRFSPEEEASLLAQSNDQKASANALFTRAAYSDAITGYGLALSSLPNYLDYEVAVLRSNIAACHIKLEEWKEAVTAATEGLECLDRVDPRFSGEEKKEEEKQGDKEQGDGVKDDEEHNTTMTTSTATPTTPSPPPPTHLKLRTKLLLRRAIAHSSTQPSTWSSLQSSLDDYTLLSTSPLLAPLLTTLDRRAVDNALRTLPPRLDAAKQAEMGEMMGKLKGLGNGLLKPFGLSTDNFKVVQDPGSGGYSLSFDQGR
ncbi:hypothetical protein K490DRAFT_75372 [Saccharata proteae CBS 121410]|uniref:Tetratricopeptide repeat protein 1 n=1 Tax=Saccharata proteae CBS 121410 TaxID=1314787 RepID=A0A9P4HR53_9PEZI|nr:hypothetical protein K490DRAFT_75372 [Saccharata proteae CBS 121410]